MAQIRDPRRGRGPSGADTALGLMVRGRQTRRSSTLMANWYGESLAVEWSREEKQIVERMCFSRHLVRGVISTAVRP
jgi:hypothetical protein